MARLVRSLLLRDQLGDGLRGLGAAFDPAGDLFLIELDRSRGGVGVIRSDLFDIAAIARKALITNHDAIEGLLLGPVSG